MNTETLTVHQKGDDFEIIVQHDQTGSAYGTTLSKSAYEQLSLHFVSGSFPAEKEVNEAAESFGNLYTKYDAEFANGCESGWKAGAEWMKQKYNDR